MFGALIVQDPKNAIPPEYAAAEELILPINTLNVTLQRAVARMSKDNLWQTDSDADVTLVSGILEPSLPIQSGRWYRLRLIYAAEFRAIRPMLKAFPGRCQLKLIAKDGVYLNVAPRDVRRLWLASGSRADVMLSCSCKTASGCRATFHSSWGAKTRTQLDEAIAHWGGNAYARTFVGDLFHLDISGAVAAPSLPKFKVNRPCYLVDLRKASVLPQNRNNFSFFWKQNDSNNLPGNWPMYQPEIHGQFGVTFNNKSNRMLHDDQHAMATIPLEQIQEWHVSGTQWHPFHMHIQPYQLVDLSILVSLEQDLSGPGDFSAAESKDLWKIAAAEENWFQVGDLHDTFFGLSDNVTVRFAPRLWGTGTMMVHCHFLNHEDQGMMTFFNVSQLPCEGSQCAKSIDPSCYIDLSGAGYSLEVWKQVSGFGPTPT